MNKPLLTPLLKSLIIVFLNNTYKYLSIILQNLVKKFLNFVCISRCNN